MQLDLASLASIARFAEAFTAAHARLDLLLLSAGVMALPERQATADGFEMQAREGGGRLMRPAGWLAVHVAPARRQCCNGWAAPVCSPGSSGGSPGACVPAPGCSSAPTM